MTDGVPILRRRATCRPRRHLCLGRDRRRGGALLWWLVSPVLGGLLIIGAILVGLGWTAALTFLGRIGVFGFRYRG